MLWKLWKVEVRLTASEALIHGSWTCGTADVVKYLTPQAWKASHILGVSAMRCAFVVQSAGSPGTCPLDAQCVEQGESHHFINPFSTPWCLSQHSFLHHSFLTTRFLCRTCSNMLPLSPWPGAQLQMPPTRLFLVLTDLQAVPKKYSSEKDFISRGGEVTNSRSNSWAVAEAGTEIGSSDSSFFWLQPLGYKAELISAVSFSSCWGKTWFYFPEILYLCHPVLCPLGSSFSAFDF